jgi:tetratricopeptide (TPR) repeat protein
MGQANKTPAPFSFMRSNLIFVFALALIMIPPSIWAQAGAATGSASDPPSVQSASAQRTSSEKALRMAESGRCKEALPLLKIAAQQRSDKEAQRRAGILGVRCALSLDQRSAVGEFLAILNREFRSDPEVLYVSVHAYSDLSTRAAMDLAQSAPSSYQARELNAESLEMQGKWDDAAKEYQQMLKQFPNAPGVHFRMARLYLSKPDPEAGASEKARQELQMELELDPKNAGAEYLLGELALEATQWDEAINHLSRATKLDPTFADAFLGLGMSCISAQKIAEAIPPLETYVKMQPANPAGHYHLAVAYSRAGRTEDAKREAALQKAAAEKIEHEKQKTADAAQKPGPPK